MMRIGEKHSGRIKMEVHHQFTNARLARLRRSSRWMTNVFFATTPVSMKNALFAAITLGLKNRILVDFVATTTT